jgi:3'-phosphoadenosine 5'-phosphosulfate sulfotransferase (PAPS reductase)/FAD synthetase
MSTCSCNPTLRSQSHQTEFWQSELLRRPRVPLPDLTTYDHYIVALSGGKDSVASLLCLLEMNIPRDKIELMHHDVDGREEGRGLMDWPSTPSYCRAFAKAFNLPIYFSWKEGGFRREMLRQNTATAPTHFETPHGELQRGGLGPPGTRNIFPQQTADLSRRWCSAYLKIDPARLSIINQPRFQQARTLVISGERAEESPNRANYKLFEVDHSDARHGSLRRHVDRCRIVHQWTESEIWDIIARWRINVHPAYRLGFNRLSCICCIFGSDRQWASARIVVPDQVEQVATYERQFGKTIDRSHITVLHKASLGSPYSPCTDAALIAEARDRNWDRPIFLPEGEWQIPPGAFGESNGPT